MSAESDANNASSATSLPLLSPTSLPSTRKTPKSPPLAFERTSNDALAPLVSPPAVDFNLNSLQSPSEAAMGFFGNLSTGDAALQTVVDKQAKAINQVHLAYAAEREAWLAERESLHQRIASLERLLRANNGHSPAKSPSPSISPANGGSISSPGLRHQSAAHRLSVIAEDENVEPLSQRRGGPAHSIDMPSIPTITGGERLRHNSVVAFAGEGAIEVEEIPVSPGSKSQLLSPLAPEHRALAGHTPLKAPVRPPTPPPKELLGEDIEDTPTRHNTHINTAYLTKISDEEEDLALKGPLNLPELPNEPGEHNFTQEMLCRKLERIAKTPDHEYSRPLIYAQPSPGMVTPERKPSSGLNTQATGSVTERPLAPAPTRDANRSTSSSNALASQVISPQSGIPLSLQSSHDEEREAEVHRKFDNSGVKLKKQSSINFGAPLGSLGGFGSIRRPS